MPQDFRTVVLGNRVAGGTDFGAQTAALWPPLKQLAVQSTNPQPAMTSV